MCISRTLTLIVLAVLCVAACAPAAGARSVAVSGFVLLRQPADANAPPAMRFLPGITVTVQGTRCKDVTDARGSFLLQGVKTGKVTLVATGDGFMPVTKEFTVVGKDDAVVIYMQPVEVHADQPVDHVFVSFAQPIEKPSKTDTHERDGEELAKGRALRAALIYGVNVFDLARLPWPIPNGPKDNGPTAISAAPNSVMDMDSSHPASPHYTESPYRLFWITFNPSGSALLGSTDHETIDVYDAASSKRVSQLPTNGVVNDLVRVNKLIYAAVFRNDGDAIFIIDLEQNPPARMIRTAGLTSSLAKPFCVTAAPDGSRIFVGLETARGGAVVAVDPATGRRLALAPLSSLPLGIALTVDGRYVLVSNSRMARVEVFDAATLHPVAHVGVGMTPFRIAVSPDGTKAYVTCRESDTVDVIDLATMTQRTSIAVGRQPCALAISADGKRVYVTNSGSGTVTIIDGQRDVFVRETSPQPLSKPYGVAIRP